MKELPLQEIREDTTLIFILLLAFLFAVSALRIRHRKKKDKGESWTLNIRHSLYGRLLNRLENRYAH